MLKCYIGDHEGDLKVWCVLVLFSINDNDESCE